MTVSYTTLERIAVGGMGEVFLARQEGMGGFRRTVVMKRLLPDAEGDEDAVRRFLDEARVAAALSHENVVSILEVGDLAGPFIALEYVHGENAGQLRTKARKQHVKLPAVVVARIVADAARGLAHAHAADDVDGRPMRIVHRDVAPKNIFVRADGLSKIGDFGIAKSAHRLSRTATGNVPGTLSYMSPEQARGDDVDALSDQFSLGIVLWELLAGEPLFKAASPQQTLRNVIEKKIGKPSSKRAGHDIAALDGVCLRMLERNPRRRFADLNDAVTAIENAFPEARAEIGQRAVAAFVETVAGDDLRARQRRIELGPEETALSPRAPQRVLSGDSSFPPIPPGRETDTPSRGSSSATPVTGNVDTTTPMRSLRAAARDVAAGDGVTVPFDRVDPRNDRARAERLGSASSRLRAAAAVCATVMVLGAAAAGARAYLLREPTADERTTAYLEDARKKNPITHRATFLAMADIAHVDPGKAKPVADAMVAFTEQRLQALLAWSKQPAEQRELKRSEVAALERALEAKARTVLATLGNDELATQEIDYWDYDAGMPLRWMPPDPIGVVQQDFKNGSVDYMNNLAPMRQRSVDLLAKQCGDAKAVHAFLDPLVAEREALIVKFASAPHGELLQDAAKIAALSATGNAKLTAKCGALLGPAIADTAFFIVPGVDEWQGVHDMPPSSREEKAHGDTAPETH